VGNDVVIIDNKEGNGNTFDNLAQPLLDPPECVLSYPVAGNFLLQGFNSFLQIFIVRLPGHYLPTFSGYKLTHKEEFLKYSIINRKYSII
jgi:hypothetical protein